MSFSSGETTGRLMRNGGVSMHKVFLDYGKLAADIQKLEHLINTTAVENKRDVVELELIRYKLRLENILDNWKAIAKNRNRRITVLGLTAP